MKKLAILFALCIGMLAYSHPANAAMSLSDVRENARFLSDRMAYELNLSIPQYNDVYEINYDFLSDVRYVMADVLNGYDYSIDRYYELLDMRNDDLRYVLSRNQYLAFLDREYFYRPMYVNNNAWGLRVYNVYANIGHFYFSLPINFYTYNGVHSRRYYNHGYYNGRYHHAIYRGGLASVRYHKHYNDFRRHDFIVAPHRGKAPSRYEAPRPNPHRPNVAPHPQAKPNNRPNVAPKPEQNKRPNNYAPSRNESTQRPNRYSSSKKENAQRPNNRPSNNSNMRPNQSSGSNRVNNNSRPNGQIRPTENARPVKSVRKATNAPQQTKAVSTNESKRDRSGNSRR